MSNVALPTTAHRRRIAPTLTVLVLLALGAYLFWRGHGYYVASVEARLEHPESKLLRPSGLIGHGYGIVGTALILTNLLYLVRRWLVKLSVGSLRAWLNLHVVAGLAGAMLVLFHSAFQLRTPIATTSAVSLLVLVGTGAVGLYIYRLLPRSGLLRFQERLGEIEKVVPRFARRVRESVGAVHCTTLPPNATLLRTLFTVPRWAAEARARRRAVKRAFQEDALLQKLARDEPVLIRNLVDEVSMLAAAEIDSNAASSLMRSWRSLHGFMAILMVLSVSVHVAVAWFYGYRWIWSE